MAMNMHGHEAVVYTVRWRFRVVLLQVAHLLLVILKPKSLRHLQRLGLGKPNVAIHWKLGKTSG